MKCFLHRERTNKIGRLDKSGIGSIDRHPGRFQICSGKLENIAQPGTGPFRIPDGTAHPLNARHSWTEEASRVPSAFQSRGHRMLRQLLKVRKPEFHRFFNTAVQGKPEALHYYPRPG